MFSAYEDNGYTIYALETPEQLAGGAGAEPAANAAVLPPRREGAGPVYTLLENETLGLPPETAEASPAEEYKPKLGLDFAGQPTIGVGKDPFGTYAAGGVSFVFSDMLGNHTLYTGAQVTSRFDEFGGTAVYINRKHRWNWGVGGRSDAVRLAQVHARVSTCRRACRSTSRTSSASCRSTVACRGCSRIRSAGRMRVEFSGGFRQIGFKQDVTTRIYDFKPVSRSREDETTSRRPTFSTSARRRARWCSTPRLSARRARFAAAAIGSSSSQSAGIAHLHRPDRGRPHLPDAGASVHVRVPRAVLRRYGRDAEDQRLPTLYLGYPGLVRGYDSSSFEIG